MLLINVTENLWTVPSPLAVFGIIQLNTRMTIVRLENGGLWIHSPVKWSPELNAQITKLGPIDYIVAPSCFHHMFVGPWKEHHPTAKICAPKGLLKKRDDLTIDHILQADTELWPNEIDYFEIKGMPIVQEHVFFHRSTQTLVITDLFFYLPLATGFTSFYAWINGVKNKVATPLLFKSAIKDKSAFKTSLEPLRSLDVQNLSMCHHIVLTTTATDQNTEQVLQVPVSEYLLNALDSV